MAENKFIERLQGKGTEKSVVEIKNTATPTVFTNMPSGDSNAFNTYSDHRGNATVVANGTMNWKVDDYSSLVPSSDVHGNGKDLTTWGPVTGAGLWIDAEYTFPSTGDPNHPVAMVFNPQTKWVLKFCGDNLLSPTSDTIEFTVLITFGVNNIISKTFTVAKQANKFCKEFVIDFSESNTNIIKAQGLSTMKLQLLCGTADASAMIYGGMTVLTCLQRKVEAVAISSTFANVEEVLRDGIIPSDYFNNQAYIAQVTDGDTAYAVFQRDGDEMLFVGWHQPIPDQTGNSGKFLTTDGSLMSWAQITISDVDSLQTELNDLQNQIDDLSGRGRFLSVWNCATGLAETNPPESPYTYKAGDYFIVGVVSTATPAVNYKPDGSSYTTGVASTTVESAEVNIDDTYIYDGTTWKLQANSQRTYTFAGIAGSPYDNANLTSALNAKQDTLVNQTNIKSVNGNSLLGSGNLELSTYLTYPAGWTTNSTTKAFCDDVAADSTASKGKAYLGEGTFSDLPAGIINGEVEVKIVDGTTAADKVIVLTLTSGNVAPYQWQYTYWNGGSNTSGWQTWQEPLVSGTNIKTINNTSLLGFGNITIDGLPTQTGNNGKLLTTDGSTPSWTEIKTINSGSLLGSGNIDVLVNEATATNALGVGYTTINTTYNDSINIGNASQVLANNAIALGAFASAEGQDSIAIYSSTGTAHRARTTHTGNIAIGYNALAINAAYTIAIGYNAYAQGLNSIQLGTGNVASQNTFQVWTYPMLNKTTGLIPSARLADQTSATQGQVLTLDANLDAKWTTISTMTGASAGDAGTSGLVPAPAAGDQAKFLQGDGTWANPTAAVAWGNITGTLSNQTDLQTVLSGKANTDMDNLTSIGKNISNWSSNVTNCITEIPQDIKLELNNGTLTLKAGSKVYVPNGAGVFDEVNIQSDITASFTGSNTVFIYYNQTGNSIWYGGSNSGSSNPSITDFFYNTTDNRVYYLRNGTPDALLFSFPIAICNVNNGSITSIDQVFNGFGYIGSTVFALPGIKGLIPNGRNADGTLNNTPFYVENVLTKKPEAGTTTIQAVFTINGSGLQDYSASQEKHDFTNNYNYASSNKINRISFAYCTVAAVSRKISNFRIKFAFDIVNHDDIANLAMPSNRYFDLTLGASGATYTAPADGYFSAIGLTTADCWIFFTNNKICQQATEHHNGYGIRCSIPASKGDSVKFEYENYSSLYFRFVYANGAK